MYHKSDQSEYNFSHVPGVSPDSKVETDLRGETNKITSKLDFKLLWLCVFDNFSCVLNNFFISLAFLCHIFYSMAWIVSGNNVDGPNVKMSAPQEVFKNISLLYI